MQWREGQIRVIHADLPRADREIGTPHSGTHASLWETGLPMQQQGWWKLRESQNILVYKGQAIMPSSCTPRGTAHCWTPVPPWKWKRAHRIWLAIQLCNGFQAYSVYIKLLLITVALVDCYLLKIHWKYHDTISFFRKSLALSWWHFPPRSFSWCSLVTSFRVALLRKSVQAPRAANCSSVSHHSTISHSFVFYNLVHLPLTCPFPHIFLLHQALDPLPPFPNLNLTASISPSM